MSKNETARTDGRFGLVVDVVMTPDLAEGVGFEPTETRKTSTVFETVPFVHSGTLPFIDASGLSRYLLPRFSSANGEEIAQQLAGFVATTSTVNVGPMVETFIAAHGVETGNGTRFRVRCAIDDSTDSGIDQSAGAHDAGLEGDIQRAIHQTPMPDNRRSITDRQNLCVGRGVAGQFALIVAAGDDDTVPNHDSTDWHIAHNHRCSSLVESCRHRIVIAHHPTIVLHKPPERFKDRAGGATVPRGRCTGGPGCPCVAGGSRQRGRTLRGGGGGIRTHGTCVHTLSKRADSAALAPLHRIAHASTEPAGTTESLGYRHGYACDTPVG